MFVRDHEWFDTRRRRDGSRHLQSTITVLCESSRGVISDDMIFDLGARWRKMRKVYQSWRIYNREKTFLNKRRNDGYICHWMKKQTSFDACGGSMEMSTEMCSCPLRWYRFGLSLGQPRIFLGRGRKRSQSKPIETLPTDDSKSLHQVFQTLGNFTWILDLVVIQLARVRREESWDLELSNNLIGLGLMHLSWFLNNRID